MDIGPGAILMSVGYSYDVNFNQFDGDFSLGSIHWKSAKSVELNHVAMTIFCYYKNKEEAYTD